MFASILSVALSVVKIIYAVLLSLSLFFSILVFVLQLPLVDVLFSGSSGLVAVIGFLVYVYIATVALRALARAFPLRADLKPRYAVILMILTIILLCIFPLVSFIVEDGSFADAQYDITIEGLDQDQAREHTDSVSQLLPIMFGLGRAVAGTALIYMTVFLALVLILPLIAILYIHIRRQAPKNIILFLRRFGGSADAALMSGLLRSVPKGARLVMIASPGSKTTSWDPMILIFSGFRWMRPWSNLPVYLRSSDANWKDNVAHWVTLSNVIVFDGSDLSVSMATEWTIIKKKRAELRTILMTGGTQTPIGSNRDVANIEYQLTWLAAIRRLLIGSLILAVASYLAFDIGGLGIAVGLILATLPTFLHRSLASSSRLELQTNIYQKLKHF